jgi:hypothetical protein
MSLIIDSDGKYLSGSGGTFGTDLTEMTVACWVKSIDYNTYGIFASFGPNATTNDTFNIGRQPSYFMDGFLYPENISFRLSSNLTLSQENTAWHLLVVTFKQSVAIKSYLDGTNKINDTTDTVLTHFFNSVIDEVMIGRGLDYGSIAFNARAKIAHVAMWTKELTSSQVTELWNGGTAGAGKNPTAVQTADLKFYRDLLTDSTGTGGIGPSLTATGSPSYDGDNPTVDAASGGGGGSAKQAAYYYN